MAAPAFNAEQLHSAFEIFNRHSSQLENSYRELQQRVTLLSGQLEQARSAQQTELAQKERLAQRLALLLDTLPGAIIVLDGDGVIQEQNNEAVALLNKPLSGCAWADIVQREASNEGSADGDIQLRDGRWLSLTRRLLQCEPGEILLLADVTAGRRMSELRQRRERLTAIGEMTARFAHQVRTPLASAMLYVSQLESTAGSQQAVAEKLSERLMDLGRMIDDMLKFAAGGKLADERVDVRTLFAGLSETLHSQLGAETVLEFIVDGSKIDPGADDSQTFTFAANIDALKGALINLVMNANQAACRAMRIQLGAWQDDTRVFFTVSDDGPGIADDVLPRIFDPFFTTRPQGTGLGLAVVRAVAKALGGDISVQNLSKGTRFTLDLPLPESPAGEFTHD